MRIAKVINNSLITGSNKQAFERLELYTGKPVRTVLGGACRRNVAGLLDEEIFSKNTEM